MIRLGEIGLAVFVLGFASVSHAVNQNAVSCAAYCAYVPQQSPASSPPPNREAKSEKPEKTTPPEPPTPIYEFMATDGATYGKTLQALYNKCSKLNGKLHVEDAATDGGQMIVSMKSACRDNPK